MGGWVPGGSAQGMQRNHAAKGPYKRAYMPCNASALVGWVDYTTNIKIANINRPGTTQNTGATQASPTQEVPQRCDTNLSETSRVSYVVGWGGVGVSVPGGRGLTLQRAGHAERHCITMVRHADGVVGVNYTTNIKVANINRPGMTSDVGATHASPTQEVPHHCDTVLSEASSVSYCVWWGVVGMSVPVGRG